MDIGQTGRELETRLKEHQRDWKQRRGAFVDHSLHQHSPSFDSCSILATEKSLEIRELKEAMLIAQAGPSAISNENLGMRSAVNRSRGRDLNDLWLQVIGKFPALPSPPKEEQWT